MRVVIVRHGKAESGSPDGTDFSRALRPRGEQQAAHVADRLNAMEPSVTRIVSSRAVRAWETASIIGAALGVGVDPQECLLVDEPVSVVIDEIGSWSRGGAGTLVVVGHNPQVERLAALLGGAPSAPSAPSAASAGMRTGEAVVLEIDPSEPIGGAMLDRWRLEEA